MLEFVKTEGKMTMKMSAHESVDMTVCGVFVYMLVRCCLLLEQGNAAERLGVAVVLLLYVGIGLLVLHREGVPCCRLLRMAAVLCGAMLVRVLCFDYISGDYAAHLSKWYAYFKENGGFAAIRDSVGDYNVPYLYFMAAISYFDLPDLYMIKLFSVLFDLLLAWGAFRFVRIMKHGDTELPLAAFAIVLFLPTVIVNSAYWGQCDGIYCALCLHGVNALLAGKNRQSVLLVALAFSFKLQTVFLLPVWGVLWAARKIRLRELLWFPITYVAVIVPALFMGKPLSDALFVYLNQMAEYSALTLNAPSIYQLIPYGAEVNESLLAGIGIASAGVLAAAMIYLGRCLGPRIERHTVAAMLVVLAVGVPFLLPHMHERYFYLADVFAVGCACCDKRYVPTAVLSCSASLCSYFVFLNGAFNRVLTIGGNVFVMRAETDLMLMAFACALGILFSDLLCFGGEKAGRRKLKG